MPNDQHSSQRRPHYHRGRRGNDRRGTDRRAQSQTQEPASGGGQVDVEQIMHDMRARIARRHGIDLTPQQIQELAARRLDAILDPQHARPALMEQMRRAAAEPAVAPPAANSASEPLLDESALYESHRGFLRTLRRWLNPVLKLFFNPVPMIDALNSQAKRSAAAAARETEIYTRQAEWNALHYEILQRLMLETSRTAIEMQNVAMQIESLSAKVDFNERRVRGLEQTGPQPRPFTPRPPDAPAAESPARETSGRPLPEAAVAAPAPEGGTAENPRRRRRRRRGRRSGGATEGAPMALGQPSSSAPADAEADLDADLEMDASDGHDGETGEGTAFEREGQNTPAAGLPAASTPEDAAALEPAHAFSLLQPAERHPSSEAPASAPAAQQSEPAAVTPPATPAQPTPPRDEPVPHAPVDHADPGPPER